MSPPRGAPSLSRSLRQGGDFDSIHPGPTPKSRLPSEQRYYDFNVWSEDNRVQKLRYLHRNPVQRSLVAKPEDWAWSSFPNYISGEEGIVQIESHWTALKREQQCERLQLVHHEPHKS